MKSLALTLGLLAKMNTSVNAEKVDIEAIMTEIGELKSSGDWPKGASASTIAYLTSIGQWPAVRTSEGNTVASSGTLPANDSCASATEITSLPFSSSGDTTDASTETGVALDFCGTSYSGAPAVWYKVTGTGGSMSAETVAPYVFDTRLHVYSGSCGDFTCVGGNDDIQCCSGAGLLSRVEWDSVACEEYFILVHAFIGTDWPEPQFGQYNLEVTSDTAYPNCSEAPSMVPSKIPSSIPSSEPSWVDDEQCKKKDPENDVCAELDGRCKVDCEDDEDFVCVPGLCSYDRNWDKPTKSPKATKSPEMRELKEEEVDVVDIEITADGHTERKLKATKAPSEKTTKFPKATKAPKSSCACRVPRRNGCN